MCTSDGVVKQLNAKSQLAVNMLEHLERMKLLTVAKIKYTKVGQWLFKFSPVSQSAKIINVFVLKIIYRVIRNVSYRLSHVDINNNYIIYLHIKYLAFDKLIILIYSLGKIWCFVKFLGNIWNNICKLYILVTLH